MRATANLNRRNETIAVMDAFLKADVPMFLWGPPGCGKTSHIEKWGSDRGYEVTTLIGSLMDPTEIGGIPLVPEGQDKHFRFALPEWFERIVTDGEKGKHIIFLDELNLAPPGVMAALLRLVWSRAINSANLPSTTRIIAAGNDPSQVDLAMPLPASMQSRVAHLDWPPLAPDAKVELKEAGWPTPEEARMSHDKATESKWEMVIGRFLTTRPQFVEDFTTGEDGGGAIVAQGRGYPTPRSWSNLIATLSVTDGFDGDYAQVLTVTQACVGEAPATEVAKYVSALDLPDPRDWLKEPESVKPLSSDDRTFAAIAGVVAYAINENDAALWRKAWECIDVLTNDKSINPSLAVQPARQLMKDENKPKGATVKPTLKKSINRKFGESFNDIRNAGMEVES